MQELSADGLSSLCRLCGEVGECFDLFDDQEQGAEILDKIQRSIGIAIKESDGLPNGICNGCHEKLLNFCCFFDQCHDTQERLQEFISIQSAIKYEACDEDEIDSQAVGDEDCGDDQDNNYFFVEIEGDEAPDYCTEPEAETQSATKTATEVMEVEEEHDLSDAQFLTVPAEDNAETCESSMPTSEITKVKSLKDFSTEWKLLVNNNKKLKWYRTKQLGDQMSSFDSRDSGACSRQIVVPSGEPPRKIKFNSIPTTSEAVNIGMDERNYLKTTGITILSKPPQLVRISCLSPPPLVPIARGYTLGLAPVSRDILLQPSDATVRKPQPTSFTSPGLGTSDKTSRSVLSECGI